MNEIQGSTFILTGASMGIGRALALQLAQAGVNLVLNSRHSLPLGEVAAECEKLGVRAHCVVGNAAESDTASELVKSSLMLGNFHGFIQAAGVLHPGPLLWELPEAHFHEVIQASVLASYQLIRHAIPELLIEGKGIAVFFGSGASEMHIRGVGAYSGAKAAEEHLARQLAAETTEIISFIFRPGTVDTRMQEQAREAQGGAGEELRARFGGLKARGELISPELAASALVRILTIDPQRFHGRIATWRDGLALA